MFYELFLLNCLVGVLILLYFVHKQRKIKQDFINLGVPYYPKLSNVFNKDFFKRRHVNDSVKSLYDLHRDAKYFMAVSLFSSTVCINDLEIIKSVLVKNFDQFPDHDANFVNEKNDPLFSKNLAVLNGNKWRTVRNLLSPSFTSSKMRNMFLLISSCAENFNEKLIERHAHEESVDIKDIFTRFANDVIATCAFGIEVNSIKNPNNEFYMTGKKTVQNNFLAIIKLSLMTSFPKLTAMLGLKIIPKKEGDFFINLIEETIKTRKEKGISRPDMLQQMIDAEKTNENSHLDIVDMAAQAFIFFLAGYENISNQTALIALELAADPDIQEKLQAEIDTVMKNNNGKPTYEAINNMPYLDAIFNESMRRHSVVAVARRCTKDFDLPPALPNSKPYTIKSGDLVFIPVAGIHRDPKYYENPDKFDPDRYVDKKITGDVMNLGFGLGPRMCIGNRFAILVTKVLLVHLLAKCDLVPCEKSCIPIKYDPNSLSLLPKEGVWLKIKPRI